MGDLADQIREAIAASGLSLNEVGRLSGVSGSQISRFMNGERSLTVDSLEAIAAALGVKIVVQRSKKRK